MLSTRAESINFCDGETRQTAAKTIEHSLYLSAGTIMNLNKILLFLENGIFLF